MYICCVNLFFLWQALESSPPKQQHVDTDDSFSDYEGSFLDDFSDLDSDSENEVV